MSCDGLSQEFFWALQNSSEAVIEISMVVHEGTPDAELRTVSFPHFLVCTFSTAINDLFHLRGHKIIWGDLNGAKHGTASTWLALEKFHKWIHTGTVTECRNYSGLGFFELWAFGGLLGAPRFQNACLKAMCAALRDGRELYQEEFTDVVCTSTRSASLEDVSWLNDDLNVLVSFCIDVVAYNWDSTLWRALVNSGGDLAIIMAERAVEMDKSYDLFPRNRSRSYMTAPYDIENVPCYLLDEGLREDYIDNEHGRDATYNTRPIWDLRPERLQSALH